MEKSLLKWKQFREALAPKQAKPILEALNEDGTIDIELLKEISLECLKKLKKKHAKEKCQ